MKTEMPKFLIVVKSQNVRDAQFSTENNADLLDEEKWQDAGDCDLAIRTVDAPTKQDAISLQAKEEGVEEDVLDAYELAG
jgi:hypothetical protein